MIKLENLNKFYTSGTAKFHALKNINLELPDKGLAFIVGKSGSGKSTLLNIIGGIDSYDSGELIIENINTKDFSRKDFNSYRNTYIGFIFQEFNVIKNLTVFENIALSLQLQNKNIKDNHEHILSTIEKVGLKGKENRKMNQLSGGERQRVAIARAIVKNPTIIIADEPTGNLDKKNRDIVMEILKDIAKEKLVIVVTHDKVLSQTYADREIVLKDGEIISNTINFEKNNNKEDLVLKPIQPSLMTSLFLSFKSLKQNLLRFIFIVLFFTVSLIFAGTTINLYFSNASLEYANFQEEYNNDYILLNQEETLYNHTIETGFFRADTAKYENMINTYGEENFTIYKSINFDLMINENRPENLSALYATSINNIIVYEDNYNFSIRRVENTKSNKDMPIRCYITDYVAESLIANNYFNDNNPSNLPLYEYFSDKTLRSSAFKQPIYIEGIIDTDFESFKALDLSDPNVFASFTDNLMFYNSIVMKQYIIVDLNDNNQLISTNNVNYTYDDFIYHALNTNGICENIKVTSYNNSYEIIRGNSPKKPPTDDDLEQIAVSTGFLKKVFDLDPKDTIFSTSSEDGDSKKDGGFYPLLNPETLTAATFSFYGYRRVMAKFDCNVVGIIEDDDPVIYFCNNSETTMYYNYLKTSYGDYLNTFGGDIIVKISDNVNVNAQLYQNLLNNDLILRNISFVKLQVVNDFINDNLILFIGIFFALCLFSILMIFNFVVTTIKNSKKDIGIFMSLGMNGFKISFIYLFQILLVSTIAFIISSFSSIIFLRILDFTLSSNASEIINNIYSLNIDPIDFDIFNITFLGFLVTFIIAYLIPIISVFIPLINLCIKKPIDVLKVS